MDLLVKKTYYEVPADFIDISLEAIESDLKGSSLVLLLLLAGIRSQELLMQKLSITKEELLAALTFLTDRGYIQRTGDIMTLFTRIATSQEMLNIDEILNDNEYDIEMLASKAIEKWSVSDMFTYFKSTYMSVNKVRYSKTITQKERGMLKNFIGEYTPEDVRDLIIYAVENWESLFPKERKSYANILSIYSFRSKIMAEMRVTGRPTKLEDAWGGTLGS